MMVDNPGIDSTVKLCLQAQGEDGSTNFFDKSQSRRIITRYGNTQITNDKSIFQDNSIKFSGDGDYLEIESYSDLTLSGDFGIGFFAYFTSIGAFQRIVTSALGTLPSPMWAIRLSNSNRLQVVMEATIVNSTVTIQSGRWYYVCVSREGNTMSMSIDGIIQATQTISGTPDPARYIGGYYTGSTSSPEYLKGYLDDLIIRIGKPIDPTIVPSRRTGT